MDESGQSGMAGTSPEEAFALLANDTRVATIEALWEAWGDGPVPFSVLRRRVGVRDAGQFHYHLTKLQDRYVQKREDAGEAGHGAGSQDSDEPVEGYVLTAAGFKVAQSVVAGTTIESPVLSGDAVGEAACPRCGGTVELSYADGMVRVHCRDCPGFWAGADEFGEMSAGYLGGWEFPPAGLGGRSLREILDASIRYMITRTEALNAGVCPDCGGTVDAALAVCDSHEHGDDGVCGACGRQFLGVIRWRCGVCKLFFGAPSWSVAVQHPQVRSLLFAAGIDYTASPWQAVNVGYERDWDEQVVSTDPLRVRLTVEVDETTRELTLDDAGRVVDATH